MELAAKLDDYGKPAWIALMVLGFILWWPIGLGILAFLLWSGRMGCKHKGGPGRWHNERTRNGSGKGWFGAKRQPPSSGNAAFDEYREEALRRLEEEQDAFVEFLERLRHAKDKAEFDQFMADRKSRPVDPDGPAAQPQG